MNYAANDMKRSIWILIIAIMTIAVFIGLFSNRHVRDDINQQGEEIINDLTIPVMEYEMP